MLEIGRGGDPATAKRQTREKWQQAAADTFEAIAIQYMKRECGMKIDAEGNATFDDNSDVRTAPDRWRILRRQVLPALGSIPVTKIRKSDIVQMLDKLADGKLKNDEQEFIEGGQGRGGPLSRADPQDFELARLKVGRLPAAVAEGLEPRQNVEQRTRSRP